MKKTVGLVAIAAALLAVTGGSSSAATAAACAGNGTAQSSPGFLATTSRSESFTFSGKVTCEGTKSGAVSGLGHLSGTCSALNGSITISGALNGTVTVATHGPAFRLSGTVNGLPITAVGSFVPSTGNCVTKPLTAATVAFTGALT